MKWETQGMPTALPKISSALPPPRPPGPQLPSYGTSCTHGGWALGLAQLSSHWYHFYSIFTNAPYPHPLRQDINITV